LSDNRRQLGGRYRVERSIGHGGMAQVYEGTDTVLGRTVAIKVLAPQYARDDAFVQRFRREAQAAAKLNHPGVVGVYDTGSDENVHYIVMEYVAGRTLADVLQDEGRLQPERAAEIARAVAQGLAFAHQAGIIHRDIKPANIMLTPTGEVKVMDFGIARAMSSETFTEAATVLGTASYLSPEQAQGEPVDARSDIYSLGVVLYEMLTGRPPFSGDSPVAVAYKHVREDPQLPSQIVPDIPPELEAIVMKAMAKNPANRYSNAQEMAADLDRFLQGQPVTATPILPGTETVMFERQHEGTAVLTTPLPPEEEGRGGRRAAGILIGLLVLAALAVALILLARSLVGGTATVAVPNLVGKNVEAARLELQNRQLIPVVTTKNSGQPPDQVIGQSPDPGTEVKEGTKVHLFVSVGRQTVQVPDITGKTVAEARQVLEGMKLRLGTKLTEQPSDTFPKGQIITQNPDAGATVPAGTAINYILSTGPNQAAVPDVVCKTVPQAIAAIQGRQLQAQDGGDAKQPNPSCPEQGMVASTDPGAGTLVDPGSTVTYFTNPAPTTPPPTSPTTTPPTSASPT
jgi:eukaryotic-like serine/threonine-protein kinase